MSTTTAAPELVTQLQVVSVPPSKLADSDHVIAWSRRSTEKTPVKDSERYRAVIVPKSSLLVPHNACSSPFYALLQATIHKLAADTFQAWVQDNMQATKMDAARVSIDRVLAFWADEVERTRVSAESVIEFLKQSATLKGFSEPKRAAWIKRLPKIAAPAYRGSIDQDDAAAIIAQLHDDDLQHPVALYIVQRCNNILAGEASAKEAF